MTRTLDFPRNEPRDVESRRAADQAVDVTVIVTVVERPEPLAELYGEYAAVLRDAGKRAEFVFVLHPFFSALVPPLLALAESGEPITVLETARSVGETALLRLGLAHAAGDLVLMVPPYRQVETAVVPELLNEIERGADVVVARRYPRRDALVNRLQNRALHLAVGRLAGNTLHDVACGVRAARRRVLEEIPLYGDFARFLPLLAIYEGCVVREVASPQHPHDTARRLYGPGVYVRRLIDVLGLFFLLRFTEKPLRFFGLIGSVLAGAGLVLSAVLVAQKLGGRSLSDRPLLLLGVLLMTLGVQAIALGLVGEMIVHFSAARRRGYRLRTSGDDAGPPPAKRIRPTPFARTLTPH